MKVRTKSLNRKSLSELCGETISLDTLADNRAEVINATNPLRLISKAGSTNPPYGSARGQIILAHMTKFDLTAYLKSFTVVKHAPGSVETVAELTGCLNEIRAAAVSFSLEGPVEGMFSVAAPVADANGVVSEGLSVSTSSTRGLKIKSKLKVPALEGGEEISCLLGFSGNYPLIGGHAKYDGKAAAHGT